MDIGLLQAWLNIEQVFEQDKSAYKTYRHNLGGHVKECDIAQELVWEQDLCDAAAFKRCMNKL
ncbi:DNA cytosine methyltransferase [Proteus mirabilis]|nr:DNA cytosine methyltransferase [Proteus mirabilis]